MFVNMLFLIYNILFPIGFIFFIPAMLFKLIRRPGWKKTYAERFAMYSAARKKELKQAHGAIWLHAVSVGETMIALQLLEKLIEKFPDKSFVLSTTTVTGQKLARDRVPENVIVVFNPLDCVFFVKRFLKLLQPSLMIVFETELWPNMILQAKCKGVKTALVNARISDRSYKGYYRWRMFFRPLLEAFNVISAQSEIDAERYRGIAPKANVVTSGNMKFDQQPPKNLADINLSAFFGPEPFTVLFGASTHPGEESLLIKTFKLLQPKYPNLKLLSTPRHAENGNDIAAELKQSGISFVQRSIQKDAPAEPVDCLLADTTGEMLMFYKKSDIVVMGKTLAGHDEGQNMIEPAMLAKPIVCGPELKNFRFLLNALKREEAVLSIASDNELEAALTRLLDDPESASAMGERAEAVVAKNRGAILKTVELLEDLL
jgi:3-deoxy-D-manno-octulosonic-acid transferase